MQLKRATEYCLRYLACLAEVQSKDADQYITRREMNAMAKLTGRPVISDCASLFGSPWIESAKFDDKTGYRLAVKAEDISLYDAICQIEYTTNLRAVFLQDGYASQKELTLWSQIQETIDKELKRLTIADLAAVRVPD